MQHEPITLTVNLPPELWAKLDQILEAVQAIKPGTTAAAPAQPVGAPATEAAPVTLSDAQPVDEATPWSEPEATAPKVTKDKIHALVMELASPAGGKRAEARAIVNDYADTISGIPAEKYGEVWQRLTVLKGGAKA